MTEDQYLHALGKLLNEAAETLDAETLLTPLITGVSSILAIACHNTGTEPEAAIEVIRNELDIKFTRYHHDLRTAAGR